MLGLPMSETTTDLVLDLQLSPVNDPQKVLWNMTMDFEGKQFDGPYYGLEDAVESYPLALQEALKPAVADFGRVIQPGSQQVVAALSCWNN